jgi:hypothetical protein
MSRNQKLGIAAGAICLLLCTFSTFTYADPQLPLADCSTELNEQPINHNSAYTDQVVIEPPITIDLEHDFEEQEWIENILTVTNPRDVAVITKIALNCETEKYWTVKAFFYYSWGPPWVKVTHSCIQKGSDFPASDYCDELEYGGYTDWILPDKDTLLDFAKSGFVSDRDRYWSSTPANETLAHCVCFDTKQQIAERRTKDLCVRCVRG